jgi:hypothetical protein
MTRTKTETYMTAEWERRDRAYSTFLEAVYDIHADYRREIDNAYDATYGVDPNWVMRDRHDLAKRQEFLTVFSMRVAHARIAHARLALLAEFEVGSTAWVVLWTAEAYAVTYVVKAMRLYGIKISFDLLQRIAKEEDWCEIWDDACAGWKRWKCDGYS